MMEPLVKVYLKRIISAIYDNMETSQNMFSFISYFIHSEILDASGYDKNYDEYCMARMHFICVYFLFFLENVVQTRWFMMQILNS